LASGARGASHGIVKSISISVSNWPFGCLRNGTVSQGSDDNIEGFCKIMGLMNFISQLAREPVVHEVNKLTASILELRKIMCINPF
jgi:hypothetical protein